MNDELVWCSGMKEGAYVMLFSKSCLSIVIDSVDIFRSIHDAIRWKIEFDANT